MTEPTTPPNPDKPAGNGLVAWLKRSLPALIALVFGLWLGLWIAAAPEPPADTPPSEATAADPHAGHDHGGPPPAAGDDRGEEDEIIWTCSMDPQVRLPEPGKCPICGMDLIPIKVGGGLSLSEDARIMAGILTTKVVRRDVARTVRLVGEVANDQSRVAEVTAWFGGRIEALYVNQVGAVVAKGDRLFTIYSPDLLVAQRELLAASRHAKRVGDKGTSALADAAHRTVQAAQERLGQWGMSRGQIVRLLRRGKARDNVTVYAPRGGTITALSKLAGSYVKAGTPVYTIVDLSRVWVELQAFETDLPWIDVGQAATFATAALPGDRFDSRVTFISPMVDATTRTVTVRLEVDNPGGALKPGMFVKAALTGAWPGPPPLVVPHSAPLLAGDRAVVFVTIAGAETPTYSMKTVTLGPRADDVWIVRDGLMEGEEVVSQGAFKLDSALQLRGDPSLMSAFQPRTAPAPLAPPAPPVPPLPVLAGDAAVAAREVIDRAVVVSQRLAADDPVGAHHAAAALGASVAALNGPEPRFAGLASAMTKLAAAPAELDALRAAYRDVSEELMPLVAVVAPGDVQVTFCPMAFGDAGAHWLQAKGEVRNPFFGAEMLTCGAAVANPAAPRGDQGAP